jgi:hypothetical protein
MGTTVRFALVLLTLLGLIGCEARIPDGRFACETDGDCPPGQTCRIAVGRCFGPDAGP